MISVYDDLAIQLSIHVYFTGALFDKYFVALKYK